MNSFIEELLKQQKMLDQFTKLNAVDEIFRQANLAQQILDANNVANIASRLALEAEGWDRFGMSAARQIADAMTPTLGLSNEAIKAALAQAAMPTALDSVSRWKHILDDNLIAAAAAAATAGSHTDRLWSDSIEAARHVDRVGSGMSAVGFAERMLNDTMQSARFSERFSNVAALARELDYTTRMFAEPAWLNVAGEAMRTLGHGAVNRFDTASIYHELSKHMAALDISDETDVEAEAETYFQIIYAFLARHVQQFGAHNLMALCEFVVGIILHIHLAQGMAAMRAEIKDIKDGGQRTAAVVEALNAKVEAAVGRMDTPADPVVKWAAGKRGALMRIAPSCGSRKMAVLTSYQVVVQMDHRGKWVQVEFLDHRTGVPRLGWTMKKHLERVTPPRMVGGTDMTCED